MTCTCGLVVGLCFWGSKQQSSVVELKCANFPGRKKGSKKKKQNERKQKGKEGRKEGRKGKERG